MNTIILLGLPLIVGGGLLITLLILARIMPGTGAAKTEAAAVAVPVRGPEYIRLTAQRIASYRRGLVVFVVLGVLTAIELAIALNTGNLVPLFLVALLKAALILQYFMHINSVWSEEEAH